MVISIQNELQRVRELGLLNSLLADKTTKKNILWAAAACASPGPGHRRGGTMTPAAVTAAGVIRTRAQKAMEQRSERKRRHGEVFTPLWVCKRMNDHADAVWSGQGEGDGAAPTAALSRDWRRYVDSRRLEIACGEAPYLVSRYDVETGEMLPIPRRIGLLDRKLRLVSENAETEAEWLEWAVRAFQATYGFDIQGDNVLIARVNLLMTFGEYLQARWGREPLQTEWQRIAGIIAWNIWQMDGLSGAVPCGVEERPLSCRIFDWRRGRSVEYASLPQEGDRAFKFDLAIGNPPYQDETLGDNKGFAPPIYHHFLERSYQVAGAAELIHPARFLFNAGSTPKQWNERMLRDPHLKVLFYEQDAGRIFSNTEIKGGVAITYHDAGRSFGAIGVFTPYRELRSIMQKAAPREEAGSLMDMIFVQNRFDLPALYARHPAYRSVIGSGGKDKRFRNNIFEKVPLFSETRTGPGDIAVLGVVKNKRQWRYLPREFVDLCHENLAKWKVLVVRVNGVGAVGEVLSTPVVAAPYEGYTQTFIGIGAFDTRVEAENALKYVKTKFARTMLGILKITQDNNRSTWRMVPCQDFTPASDIDWSRPVPEIDRQLYAKYGLDEAEAAFIDSHAREMA